MEEIGRESFESIYLDLAKHPGKCRIAESGLGWKPPAGDTYMLDRDNIASAHWSTAAKGYELKILTRDSGVVQLDGFQLEVSLFRSRFASS
jgi:structure-specific recognition protein 1